MRHVLGVEQFDKQFLFELFQLADDFRRYDALGSTRAAVADSHRGKQICALFYEPSTRTRLSFETAALRLGMGVTGTENAYEFSSAAKGETLEDSIRVLDQYGYAAIVMRHNETGAAARAAAVSTTPIINAGDGKGQHPTQALLDAYTIYRRFGRLDNLHVVLGGDLRNGRTVRSLAQLMSMFKGIRFTFVSTPQLQMGDDIITLLQARNVALEHSNSIDDSFKDADVVYWTRLQKERLNKGEKVTENFVINSESLKALPEKAIIMHPLPRIDEIEAAVDDDPRAIYFEQAGNGLFIRMALLDMVARLPR